MTLCDWRWVTTDCDTVGIGCENRVRGFGRREGGGGLGVGLSGWGVVLD